MVQQSSIAFILFQQEKVRNNTQKNSVNPLSNSIWSYCSQWKSSDPTPNVKGLKGGKTPWKSSVKQWQTGHLRVALEKPAFNRPTARMLILRTNPDTERCLVTY